MAHRNQCRRIHRLQQLCQARRQSGLGLCQDTTQPFTDLRTDRRPMNAVDFNASWVADHDVLRSLQLALLTQFAERELVPQYGWSCLDF